jgi:hypothetical protein
MKQLTKFWTFIGKHQLASFVTLSIVIAFVMTIISLRVYVTSGAVKLDLSRPGYEQARQEVNDGDNSTPFSSSGTLTPEALKDFNDRLNKQQTDLGAMGNFADDTLTDENLGLQ